jgi:hypothetical protein
VSGVILVCLVLGLVALLIAFSRWLAGRPWAAAGNAALGVALLLVVQHVWPAAANLRTYEPMPAKSAPVAQLRVERTGTRTYRITLTRLPAGRMQVFHATGDQWRLDARALFWSERAARLGLSPAYRLDRLGVRLSTAGEAAAGEAPPPPDGGFDLADREEPGEDVWAQARTGVRWPRDLEASMLYGPWLPLADGARFDAALERVPGRRDARIVVRPAGEAGGEAMGYTPPGFKRTEEG